MNQGAIELESGNDSDEALAQGRRDGRGDNNEVSL